MTDEFQALITNSKNPDVLGRLLRYAADRLDEIRREIFPKHAQPVDVQKGSENDEGGANGR